MSPKCPVLRCHVFEWWTNFCFLDLYNPLKVTASVYVKHVYGKIYKIYLGKYILIRESPPSENKWLLKTSFKGKFLNKQWQNTKQVVVWRNILDEEFWREASVKFPKTGRLFLLRWRWREMNQNRDICPSDGERR